MELNKGAVEQTQQNGEKKEFVATVSPATNNSGVCAYQNLADKLELAGMKGDTNAKAKFDTLQKLPVLAQEIFNKVQESGNNQNVTYTAKQITADQTGKDGTVYAKAGDLDMSITVKTGNGRKMILDVDEKDGDLKTGFIKVEDMNLTHEVEKKDGSGKFPVPDKIEFKDFTDREKTIFKAISDKGGEQEKADWKPAFAVKREIMNAIKAEGVDAYVALDKNKPREYTDKEGNQKTGYDEKISFGKVGEENVMIFSIQSARDAQNGLTDPIRFSLSSDGDVQTVEKVTFAQENERTIPEFTPVELDELPAGVARAVEKIFGGAEQAQTFTKTDVQVEKAQSTKTQEGRNY